jgi:hypothetical protein
VLSDEASIATPTPPLFGLVDAAHPDAIANTVHRAHREDKDSMEYSVGHAATG